MREKPRFDEYGWTQWGWLCRNHNNLILGENTQIGTGTIIDALHGVKIEDGVKIGFNVVIISNSTIDNKQGSVTIEKNACIGSNAVIMPGVTIGKNSKVGALSFVKCNVPQNQTWVGQPAKGVFK